MAKALLFLVFSLLCLSTIHAKKTALDRYVAKPDNTYSWSLNATTVAADYTIYTLRMTSQTWLSSEVSNNPIWRHWLQICVPNTITTKTGFMWVGDKKNDFYPTKLDFVAGNLCTRAGAVSATVFQIPNEPITFTDDPNNPRSEDGIIVHTWRHFIDNNTQHDWVLQLPMTKSVVRAMDTVQAFVKTLPQHPKVKNFIVGGASKRGWITYLTTAVDKRVIGMIPTVIPVGNIVPNFNSVWQNIGQWGYALADYVESHIFDALNTPRILPLVDLVDPISYNQRWKHTPKLIVCGTLDEFFAPDQANFFYQQLSGPKNLHIAPNANHPLSGYELQYAQLVVSFFLGVDAKVRFPEPSWTLVHSNSTAQIIANSRVQPKKVLKWTATTDPGTYRDFRLFRCFDQQGNPSCFAQFRWVSEDVTANYTNNWSVSQNAPAAGQWTGFFLQFFYDLNLGKGKTTEYVVSTEVNIVPDYRPFPSCGLNC